MKEIIFTAQETRAINNRYTEVIRQRAEKLTRNHPELADSISWYLENEEQECEILESDIVGAIWLLQRN